MKYVVKCGLCKQVLYNSDKNPTFGAMKCSKPRCKGVGIVKRSSTYSPGR